MLSTEHRFLEGYARKKTMQVIDNQRESKQPPLGVGGTTKK